MSLLLLLLLLLLPLAAPSDDKSEELFVVRHLHDWKDFYQRQGEVGEGNYSQVIRCRPLHSDRDVVKIYRKYNPIRDHRQIEFLIRFASADNFQGRYVGVPLPFDVFQSLGRYHLVMPLFQGGICELVVRTASAYR
jgi:hypothetical protein